MTIISVTSQSSEVAIDGSVQGTVDIWVISCAHVVAVVIVVLFPGQLIELPYLAV